MARNLLPIRILFHATFAFIYLHIIVLAWTPGLNWRDPDYSFVQNYFDGIPTFAALVGLGILAALDILTIRRKANQRALLIIEIIVVVLMPLSIWPLIISSIGVVWPSWYSARLDSSCFGTVDQPLLEVPFFCYVDLPIPGDEVTSASVVSATVAILALNTAFLLYIGIAAVKDKVRGCKFLTVYPGDPSLSVPRLTKNWYLWGNQRTPTERAEIISHCADYIFQHTVFRKHAFEPAIWAIFRGIIAVYSCVGLVAFSAYSALSEAQLRGTLIVSESISTFNAYELAPEEYMGLSVASFLMAHINPATYPKVSREQYPPPILTGWDDSWQNPIPGFWTITGDQDWLSFNISWTGNYSLATWVTSYSGANAPSNGDLNSTQVKSTNPLILAPFKHYSISVVGTEYILPEGAFILWSPDLFSVDGVSGSNTSMATFSFNGYQPQILVRDFRPPSIFSSIAHVLSDIGGTLSVIDGLFALVFGRTIAAILFGLFHFQPHSPKLGVPHSEYAEHAAGTRIVSPFGLLGIVTRNRFKRLIHEQYPRMQEDIEHGGIAAYISEVAIDAALMDKPSDKGNTSSAESSSIGDEAREGNAIGLRRMPVESSASYLRLPYIVEELGDLESNPLVRRQTDHE